jgi:hypothetical protein
MCPIHGNPAKAIAEETANKIADVYKLQRKLDQAIKERDEAVALVDELKELISESDSQIVCGLYSDAGITNDQALEKIAQFKGGKGES